ncbi:hypothetical protein ACU686_19180 [Yinghuangia aomiensis]
MTAETETHVRLATLRLLYRVVADLNATRDLRDNPASRGGRRRVRLGFNAAAVNVVRADGDLEVSAVAGGDHRAGVAGDRARDLSAALVGRVGPRADWERLLASAEHWGPLRFLSHRQGPHPHGRVPAWVPDIPVSDHPDAWHPYDALLAPSPPRKANSSASCPSTSPSTAADPARGAARCSGCSPPKPPSPSTTPGCAPRWCARSPGSKTSSTRCGPARRASGTPSNTRRAAWS